MEKNKLKKTIIKIDPGYFRPTEIYELRGDARKAKRELKWKPKITFEDGLKKTIYWYVDNIQWSDSIMKKSGYSGYRIGKTKENQ